MRQMMLVWRVWARIFISHWAAPALGIRCVFRVVVVIQFGCEQLDKHWRGWCSSSAVHQAASVGESRGVGPGLPRTKELRFGRWRLCQRASTSFIWIAGTTVLGGDRKKCCLGWLSLGQRWAWRWVEYLYSARAPMKMTLYRSTIF